MTIRPSRESIRQNLLDAGCDSVTTQKALSQLEAERVSDCLRLLSRHRRELLDQLHWAERRIDCLDYLVYELEHQQK